MLTSPQLTAEWENNLTQIAKGAADPGEFLSGIEAMARELVQTHAAALDGKKDLFLSLIHIYVKHRYLYPLYHTGAFPDGRGFILRLKRPV